MIRILFVEDDPRLRESVGRLLGSTPDFGLVASFGSAEEALGAARWNDADVLVCDLGLPGMQGPELISAVRLLAPKLLPMAYTLFDDQPTVFKALQAGACGYVLKGCSATELPVAIRSIHAGESPMSPGIARFMLRHFLAHPVDERENPLTLREEEIVQWLAGGLLYKEVADQLGISIHTVHSHIKKIYSKLEVGTRRDAIEKAKRLGYGARGLGRNATPG